MFVQQHSVDRSLRGKVLGQKFRGCTIWFTGEIRNINFCSFCEYQSKLMFHCFIMHISLIKKISVFKFLVVDYWFINIFVYWFICCQSACVHVRYCIKQYLNRGGEELSDITVIQTECNTLVFWALKKYFFQFTPRNTPWCERIFQSLQLII